VCEGGAGTAAIDDLAARMPAAIWYRRYYFRLSFDKQHKLGEAARVWLSADEPHRPMVFRISML